MKNGMIRVPKHIKDELDKLKVSPYEPYWVVIERLIKFYRGEK